MIADDAPSGTRPAWPTARRPEAFSAAPSHVGRKHEAQARPSRRQDPERSAGASRSRQAPGWRDASSRPRKRIHHARARRSLHESAPIWKIQEWVRRWHDEQDGLARLERPARARRRLPRRGTGNCAQRGAARCTAARGAPCGGCSRSSSGQAISPAVLDHRGGSERHTAPRGVAARCASRRVPHAAGSTTTRRDINPWPGAGRCDGLRGSQPAQRRCRRQTELLFKVLLRGEIMHRRQQPKLDWATAVLSPHPHVALRARGSAQPRAARVAKLEVASANAVHRTSGPAPLATARQPRQRPSPRSRPFTARPGPPWRSE